MSAVETADITHAGVRISRLGFGCAGLMRIASRRGRSKLLDTTFDLGVRHYDVARMYGLGTVESEIGRFVASRRDEVTIATKFGIDAPRGFGHLGLLQQPARAFLNRVPAARNAIKQRSDAFVPPRRYDADIAQRSLDKSLSELNVDYIDILFVHDPNPSDDVASAELADFFEGARAAGKIRSWGVSQDAHPGLRIRATLGSSAILQIRDDVFSRQLYTEPTIVFGVLGAPRDRIVTALKDEDRRLAWNSRLGSDVLAGDTLAQLLIAEALDANPGGAALFSTTQPDRIAPAVAAANYAPPAEILATFRDLVASIGDVS